MKNAIFVLSVLVLSACAAAPEHHHVAVAAAASDARDELECVGKCLEFGDESCESCVDRCTDAPPSAAVAVFGREEISVPSPR